MANLAQTILYLSKQFFNQLGFFSMQVSWSDFARFNHRFSEERARLPETGHHLPEQEGRFEKNRFQVYP
jgi:hypothetical protein